jgi:hypothetical protein
VRNPLLPPPTEHAVEPVLAWRVWRLHVVDGAPVLAPTTPRPDWPAREPIRATCTGSHTRLYMVFNPELERFHHSPVLGCTCGVHAAKDPRRLARGVHGAGVIGRVAMWGRVIEHTRGWRAELAYPWQLRLICWRCLRLRRLPGVPSVVVGDGAWPRVLCADHAGTASGRTTDARAIESALLDRYGVEVLPTELLSGGARAA